MNVLAVDVGFGNTKHCRAAGARSQVGLLPSIAAPTSAGIFEGFNQSADGLVEVLADKSRFSVGPQVLQRCPGDLDRVMDPTFSTTTTDLARLRGALTLARKDDPSLEWLDLLESGGASILGGVGRHATIGHVVLRGGGAHFYAERLAEFFRDRRLLEDDPGLANVRGFSAYGELHARSAGTR